MPEIELLPNQSLLYKELRNGTHSVIGVGGGRGSSKSSGADRCILTLMAEIPGISVCLIMRTWVAQVVPFHIEALRTSFPWITKDLKTSPPAVLRMGKSRCEFKYSSNYDQVEEAFRSGNYNVVLIDQAEQFTLREITEIRKACRSAHPKFPLAKLVLLFNMRGSGIQDLKKMFLSKEIGDPDDYIFFKFDPWSNYVWVQAALKEDGYTVEDYYRWTDDQRKAYAAVRGQYTKTLANDDAVISKADWEGSWDSIEGAYFANSFDLEAVRLNPSFVEQMRKPWANYWLSDDWGKSHYNATYWHYRIALSPSEASQYLGWSNLTKPINVVVTYREMVVNEKTSAEVGRLIGECTPESERKLIKAFFLSPEEVTGDPNSVGSQMGKELRQFGMPFATKADNDRKGGWTLMDKLLKASKFHGMDSEGKQYDDAWLISSECPQLLAAIPILMRDPKNLDVVLKTDLSTAKIEQDCSESARYGLKSMLAPRKMTEQDKFNQQMNEATPEERMMLAYRQAAKAKTKKQYMPGSWKR
jgi:hypothetical protein